MTISKKIALNSAVLILLNILLLLIGRRAVGNPAFIILQALLDLVYIFVLVQVFARNKAILFKHLFDRESPVYKQIDIPKIVLMIVVVIVMDFVGRLIALIVPSGIAVSLIRILIVNFAYYFVLTGKNPVIFKSVRLLLPTLAITAAATVIFLLITSRLQAALSTGNSLNDYINALDFAAKQSNISCAFSCVIVCTFYVFHAIGASDRNENQVKEADSDQQDYKI